MTFLCGPLKRRRLHVPCAQQVRGACIQQVRAAHFLEAGTRIVFMRSAIRPPASLRPLDCRPLPEAPTLGSLWELPAGLVEPEECGLGEEGLRRSAARELEEETGYRARKWTKLISLYASPGYVAEKMTIFAATGPFRNPGRRRAAQ